MILNTATIVEIVQHYFETVLFQAGYAPTVADVKVLIANSIPVFEVKLTDE
jgi:hypothetical protein